MTTKKKDTDEAPPASAGETPEPEGTEPDTGAPVGEGGAASSSEQPAGTGEVSPSPAAPPASGPPPDLGQQIAGALRDVDREREHEAEHAKLADVLKPEPERPKSLLDRLKWGA